MQSSHLALVAYEEKRGRKQADLAKHEGHEPLELVRGRFLRVLITPIDSVIIQSEFEQNSLGSGH